jgi:hypothetical protein
MEGILGGESGFRLEAIGGVKGIFRRIVPEGG